MLLNAEKQMLLNILSLGYSDAFKNGKINDYRNAAKNMLPTMTLYVEQIERSLKEEVRNRKSVQCS